ncbi:hypothetical protein CEXT_74511 [Caerostris extrusa]|uniref:Uncharacterized protein n=1 Tax=Caerostris extrusa TaxID=172846 RepID=A0AAV4T5H7_CAEEX|nr:hypothetical protein CEXT_74511 [Caerostris extrusa]
MRKTLSDKIQSSSLSGISIPEQGQLQQSRRIKLIYLTSLWDFLLRINRNLMKFSVCLRLAPRFLIIDAVFCEMRWQKKRKNKKPSFRYLVS